MKKALSVLGVAFIAIVVLLGGFVWYAATLGAKFDASSKAYVDLAIPAIAQKWSTSELLGRSAGALRQSVNTEQLHKAFDRLSILGKMVSYEGSKGESHIAFTVLNGKSVRAQYFAKVKFENGEANFNITLIQLRDHWQIIGFYVDSPALAP